MKKHKWFAALAVMIMALAFAGCQINSDNHEHSFSKDWTSDATDHWHAATCEHTKEVSDKAAHTFGDYVSNNDATTESDGTKTRKCSVCGYEDTVTDEKSKTVATPAFSVASGEVDSGTSVTITCSTEGAKIYYTTDGIDPTASSTEYTAAISITRPMTLKAIAVKSGMNNSVVASASYTIKGTVATPEFSVASGAVDSGTRVTITCSTEGAKIYYTTDGNDPTASSTPYTGTISIEEAVTVKAIAVKDGMNDSAVASVSYTIKGTVATPAFSVASGAVDSGTTVTITCSTEGAKIYYTTDGSDPTASSTAYTAAISVTRPMTLKVIAVKDGMNNSAVASVSYTIKGRVATPAFSVASGAVNSGTSVTITCSTEGAKIYYTTNGNDPTEESTEYTGAISVTPPMTLKAIAVKDGMNNSVVASASYTIKGTVATPAFSVASGAVNSGTSVTISCSTEGAKIYYTTDGTEPTASSTEYTAAISVTPPMTLKAIAVKSGMNGSAVASASYTIKETVATPEFSVASGAVDSGTSVTITSTTDGATIYYTTNGNDPTEESTEYTGAISVTAAVTVKAIAVKDGMNDSAVASASYTISSGNILEGFVEVKGGTVVGKKNTKNRDGVFIEGRTVTLSDFYMSQYEVTQDEYSSVMTGQKVTVSGTEYTLNATPSHCTEGNSSFAVNFGTEQGKRPVEGVTWYDAVYYCNAKSKKEGLKTAYDITVTSVSSNGNIEAATVKVVDGADGYRLPTEAEWEYAARGGDPSKADWDYTFSGADTAAETEYWLLSNPGLDAVGWYSYNNDTGTTGSSGVTSNASGKGTHQVGQKAPNALGIYDMSGNVEEWCYDYYGIVSTGEENDPLGSSSGGRVIRGGSWDYGASFACVCYRSIGTAPSSRVNYLGFRVVRSAQ